MTLLSDAFPAPRELIYLATLSSSQRATIRRSPALAGAIRNADPGLWAQIIARHVAAQRIPVPIDSHDCDGMRRQAIDDLNSAVQAYGQLTDGRRTELFRAVCRLAKYVTNGVLQRAEVIAEFSAAASVNGAVGKYGQHWAQDTISRAMDYGQNDPLPPLHRRYRSPAKSALGESRT